MEEETLEYAEAPGPDILAHTVVNDKKSCLERSRRQEHMPKVVL